MGGGEAVQIKTSSTRSLNNPLIVDGKILSKDVDKANALNQFFCQQATLEDDNTLLPTIHPLPQHNLSSINITATLVKDLLRILNTSKATGPDNIHPKILKMTADTISSILAKLFNFSIRSGTFPEPWKLAFVTALFKKGEMEKCSNYRPISLLSILSKVFERCVFREVFNFLIKHKKLSKLQAAYTPNSSTEFQLIEIYNTILQALEEGKQIRFVFCDVSKAFDRVWHRGLLHKLEEIGIRGTLLQWFKAYLQNRKQRVSLNGQLSDIEVINAGVPQGSILGPLLYIIYMNDIVDTIGDNIRLYADDCSIYVIGKNQMEIADKLNEDLERIALWADMWKVKFNPNKTVNINFTRHNAPMQLPIHMNGIPIRDTTTHTHLGVVLQSNSKWNNHIQIMTEKNYKKIDILRHLKYKFDRRTLELLYMTFIRPALEYGSSVWTNITKDQQKEIENVQLAAARIVTGAIKGTPHKEIYQECKWPDTLTRRSRKNMVNFYKIYHKIVPEYLIGILPNHLHQNMGYNLRDRNNLASIKIRTTHYGNSFFPSQIEQWNKLPINIRFIGSLRDFKLHMTSEDKKCKAYYYTGQRYGQIIHARLRMGCSALRFHLYSMKIIDRKECDCGFEREDAEHYLLNCHRYHNIRHIIYSSPIRDINLQKLLYGDPQASTKANTILFNYVIQYILTSKRFGD